MEKTEQKSVMNQLKKEASVIGRKLWLNMRQVYGWRKMETTAQEDNAWWESLHGLLHQHAATHEVIQLSHVRGR